MNNMEITPSRTGEMEIMPGETVCVKSSRLKSLVWNDFDRVRKGDTYVAICRHCKRRLSGSSTSGTSHLRNHLIRCRRRSNHDVSHLLSIKRTKKDGALAVANYSFDHEQMKGETLGQPKVEHHISDGAVSVAYTNFDNKRSEMDLARMIILHGYPLTMVEHAGFQQFVRNLQPLFALATFNRVEADCIEIYQKEKQKVCELLDKLPGKISVSADTWVAEEGVSYLSLTAHYIDEGWQLKKKLLNFIMIDASRTEEMLSEVIMKSLMDWDIERKLFSLTCDSNPTNDYIVCAMRDRLSENRFLLYNGQLFDLRCFVNVLKLMAQDSLEALSEVIHKIRESIKYTRSSPALQKKFGEMIQLIKSDAQIKCLYLDDPLTWISTYSMLEVAIEYKEAFSLLQEQEIKYTFCPSDTEWTLAGTLTSYLKLFFDVTEFFTSTKTPTANIFFSEVCDVHLLLIEWCQNSDGFISTVALKMKRRFDEYWKKCNLALPVAAILDPRFKMKLVEYYYPRIYPTSASKSIEIVSNCMKALYDGHAICSPLDGKGLACQVGTGPSRDRLAGFDKFLNETSQTRNKSDLDKYLEEPLFPLNMEFDILNWWKVQAPRYPILSMMARNILGIPMSKVSLEAPSCSGTRALNSDRSSLKPETVQALVCAQDWMKNEAEDPKYNSSDSPLPSSSEVNDQHGQMVLQ